MAIQRLTLTQIETAILQNLGYSASTAAPWTTSANLYLRINDYVQRLPQKVSALASQLRKEGVELPYTGIPRFDMWRSSATLTATAGSSTVHFPADYDQYISFWDATNSAPIYPVDNTSRYHLDILKKKSAGPPEAIEIGGFVSSSGWVREGTLYPATIAGTTPSITLEYWRVPASMSLGTDSPDLDPKYESIAVFGPIVDLSRTTGKEHERFMLIEKEMLSEMAMTARGM